MDTTSDDRSPSPWRRCVEGARQYVGCAVMAVGLALFWSLVFWVMWPLAWEWIVYFLS